MKAKIVSIAAALLVLFGFSSCEKDPNYIRFSEKELDFVSYKEGQMIEFIDTSGHINVLKQQDYNRDFFELFGFFGSHDEFVEQYWVSYGALSGGMSLYLSVEAEKGGLGPGFSLSVNDFRNENWLSSFALPEIIMDVNGRAYENVYAIKLYKVQNISKTDSATVFWNRQFGLLQMMYSNGKSITRVD